MSVLALVAIRCKPGQRENFLEAMADPVAQTRANPQCSRLEFAGDVENENSFILIEEWTSIEAHKQQFDHFMETGTLEACIETWDGMPASIHYQQIDE